MRWRDISFTKAISEEEIYNHINQVTIHKSPGSDGYTNEFYKEFQYDLILLLWITKLGKRYGIPL